ncbi:hypothetical protein, partial [Desulfovibrio piger]|uniref:hypothetical protein n=1 Tax=Desulfovibrio piger TaxID=901 RepID=UPI00241C5FF6
MEIHRPGLPAQKKRTSSDVLFFGIWIERRDDKGSDRTLFSGDRCPLAAIRSRPFMHILSCLMETGSRRPGRRPSR